MKLLARIALSLLTIFSINVMAADNIKFNGFASVVSGIDLSDENARSDYNSETFDNLQESRLGLQMTAQLEDGVRFIGQAIGRGNAESGFISNYEWAYFDFNVGSSGKLKVGRVRIPFYKYSDYLDIGYAYHWIKPPEAQYGISFSNADGVSYTQNFQLAGMDNSLTALYGRYQGTLRIAGTETSGEIRNITGARWNFGTESNEFYLSYWQGDCIIEATPGLQALVTLADTTPALGIDSSDIAYDGDFCYFYGGGYKATFGDFGLHAEVGTVDIEDAAAATSLGGFFGATYQMGEYLLHANYEMVNRDPEEYDGAAAAAVNAALAANGGDSTNISVGVRKDIGFSSAMKFEVHQYSTSDGFNPNSAEITAHTPDDEYSATIVKVGFDTMF